MKLDEDSDGAIYDIEWAELLGVDEMPLSVPTQPGMKVLAPWRTSLKERVNYAPASVCGEEAECGGMSNNQRLEYCSMCHHKGGDLVKLSCI